MALLAECTGTISPPPPELLCSYGVCLPLLLDRGRTMLNYGNFLIGTGCRHSANYGIISPKKIYTNPCCPKIGNPLQKFINSQSVILNTEKPDEIRTIEIQIFELAATRLNP